MEKFKNTDLVVTINQRRGFNNNPELVLDVNAPELAEVKFVAGWSFNLNDRKTAERLKRCIESGKGYKGYEIKTNADGKTYVCAETAEFFHGKWMKGSLKKLGF